MGGAVLNEYVDVKMDAKRRVALPSHFLEGIPPVTRLVAHVEAPGRFVIETPEAAVAAAAGRIWADLTPAASGHDAPADVRAMRDEDMQIADANAQARSENGANGDQDAASRLLAALGLADA